MLHYDPQHVSSSNLCKQPHSMQVESSALYLHTVRLGGFAIPLLYKKYEIEGQCNHSLNYDISFYCRIITFRYINHYILLFQITNLMHNSFIFQQYVCYTTILNMFRAARCSKNVENRSVTYTGCPRRNVKYFGRVFLELNYTDITQNTYIQS